MSSTVILDFMVKLKKKKRISENLVYGELFSLDFSVVFNYWKKKIIENREWRIFEELTRRNFSSIEKRDETVEPMLLPEKTITYLILKKKY